MASLLPKVSAMGLLAAQPPFSRDDFLLPIRS